MPNHAGQSAKRDEVQRLFLRHSAAIRGFIYALLPHNDAADDLLQDVFVTVVEKADDFESGTNFLGWVYTITKFKLLALRRSATRFKVLSPEAIEAMVGDARTDERPEVLEVRVSHLRRCLEQLAPASRQLVELRYRESKSPTEIAAMGRGSRGSVNVGLSKARAFLRRCMDSKMVKEGGMRATR